MHKFLASSRCSVSWGEARKNKKNIVRGSERMPVGKRNKKVIPGIPGSGIPSHWSILTDFVNARALLTQDM